ncbi:hypothetical protein [Azospirillum sp. TSO22-1]|uniref:hypothetical protein n=1 Tax=Azospirillum sp. TSO22-1 TaxID=716789 RepID=UPI000D61EF36|nr:hypothetical protein [Azospirillum sp. TSO22-1]PWC52756.1 hypothetical protein TSO221_12695 [Azospirillum sp. TSO22-1]
MIRTSLLAGFASLALFAAPAMAQNVSNISNTAAGIGNTATQSVTTMQRGGGLFAGPNVANVANTAAGIGNTAAQGATVLQRSGGRVPFGGPNFANVSNLSAGIGNFAGQGALVRQR